MEIITTVLLSHEKPNKNKPGVSGNAGEPEASASQPPSRLTPYIVITRGGGAASAP